MIFVALGLIAGGAGFGLVRLEFRSRLRPYPFAEVTLILVLSSDAAQINLAGLRREGFVVACMLAIGLPLAILFGAIAAIAIPLGLPVWQVALLAAILAPTDAALGQAVVTSPLVPERVREALTMATPHWAKWPSRD